VNTPPPGAAPVAGATSVDIAGARGMGLEAQGAGFGV